MSSNLSGSNMFIDTSQLQIIGSGIQYPNPFNQSTGGVSVSTGEDRINQSLSLILSTPVGTRIFNPLFGSNLKSALFENLVDTSLLTVYIQDAISQWEKRIAVTSIQVVQDSFNPHQYNVSISYNIVSTNVSGSYVYPFFTQPFLYGYGNNAVQQGGVN